MKKSDAPQELNVIARSPFELYYEGSATSVSASNRVGNFDILPGHADFFSMLSPGTIVIETNQSEPVNVRITSGIITVRDNQAMLFLNM